jgi:AcrR family transcriptional regulator
MKAKNAKARAQPRADAIRNRERLLVAATKVFSADAGQASLEAVAREAGVGIGTLYRHFPTREALFEAVYRHEVDQLFELAEKLSRSADPVEGLRKWLHANIRLVATKKGMVEALQLVAHGSSELKTYSFDRLTAAIAMLLDRGVAAGVFRSDVSPDELLRALVGIFYSQSAEKWQPGAVRLVNVFVDGLCNSTRRGDPRRR